MRKISILLGLLLIPTLLFGVGGDLDSTFSGDGAVAVRIRTNVYSGDSRATALLVQPDEKIVVAGYARESGSDQLALARFTVGGSLDGGFGQSGTVITNFDECAHERINGIVLQADGKIVAGGYCELATDNKKHFLVVRYNTNGTPDNSFSGDGTTTTAGNAREITQFDGGASPSEIMGIALQSDQKIVAAGYVIEGVNWHFALARYDTAGILDTTFGDGGTKKIPFTSGTDLAYALAIQPDDKIITAGGAGPDFALARCDADCRDLDPTFGTAGKVVTPVRNYSWIRAIALQSDGKIVVSGASNASTAFQFAVARYDSSGNPDATFGSGPTAGVVETPFDSQQGDGRGVAIVNGKIFVGGYSYTLPAGSTPRSYKLAVVAYRQSDGALDTSFGNGGKVIRDAGLVDFVGAAVALQPDGRLLVAGHSRTTDDTIRDRFAVIRIWDRDSSDLDLTLLSANRQRAVKGAEIIYTATYENRAGDLAREVVVTSRFSSPVELVAGNHGCARQSASDGTVTITCPRRDIAISDGENSFSYTVKSTVTGVLSNTTVVSSSGHDLNTVNSSRTLPVTIVDTDDPDDDPDDEPEDDPADDDPDEPSAPQPPDEHRQRRSFDISEEASGEKGGGGGCRFVPGASATSHELLLLFLASIPLFLLSLKEFFKKS